MPKYEQEEPEALMRSLAYNMRQHFIALCQSGFTEQQALTIIGVSFGTAIAQDSGGDSPDGI